MIFVKLIYHFSLKLIDLIITSPVLASQLVLMYFVVYWEQTFFKAYLGNSKACRFVRTSIQ